MGETGKRVVIVPRWAGSASTDWYGWLAARLGASARLDVSELDVASAPTIAGSTAELGRVIGASSRPSLLVGHSVGCQVILRWLGDHGDPSRPFDAALLVAGWWTVDEPWPSLLPWMEKPFDVARARASVKRFEVLLSDDDPFTSDWERSRSEFEEKLGAHVHVQPGARHFNNGAEPKVLERVRELLDAVA